MCAELEPYETNGLNPPHHLTLFTLSPHRVRFCAKIAWFQNEQINNSGTFKDLKIAINIFLFIQHFFEDLGYDKNE